MDDNLSFLTCERKYKKKLKIGARIVKIYLLNGIDWRMIGKAMTLAKLLKWIVTPRVRRGFVIIFK